MTADPYRSREYKLKSGGLFAWGIALLCIAAFLAASAFIVSDPAWSPSGAYEPGVAMFFTLAFDPFTRGVILGLATLAIAATAFAIFARLSRRKPVLRFTSTDVACSTTQGVRTLAWADVTDIRRMGSNLVLTGRDDASLIIPVMGIDAPLGEIETLARAHVARSRDVAAPESGAASAEATRATAARAAGPDYSATAATFETKVLKAKWALVFEQVWLRLWVLLALVAAFVLVSLGGVWPLLGTVAHFLLMSLFAIAALGWLVFTARIDWPARDIAIRRIESVSGIPHRPATSYEDTLTASAGDGATAVIWQAHRARMAGLIGKLKAGVPAPSTYRFDPFALRALLVLFIVLAGAFAGRGGLGQLTDAFRFGGSSQTADARLDAWVTPPDYTGRAPVMLADGANPIATLAATAGVASKPLEVPEKSTVIVRSSGIAREALAMELVTPGQDKPIRIDAAKDNTTGAVSEVRTVLEKSATVRVLSDGEVLAEWPITIIPDNVPGIALTKNPEKTSRGAMKLTYFVQDDYGVASAEVKFERAKKNDAGSANAWAKKAPLTGPRPPLSRPPVLALRLPSLNAKQGESFTYHEMGSHPWAGQRVMMTLEAKDVGGKIGRSQAVEMILPERVFTKPLAKAVVEQRKKLLEDPRYRNDVMVALDALTLEAEGYIEDPRVYLGLRAAYYRLERDRSRAGMTSVIEQLWHTALRIEDGDLSDAERALRDAQDRLAKALEDGASDEEIQKLMQELKQAFNEFAKQMSKENENQADQQQQDGQNQDQQTMSQEDLDRMMREMEEMAKNGSREQAKEMLAEMRDMMERMESSKQNAQQMQKSQDAQKMMRKMGEAIGEQQDIMDETFDQQRQKDGQQGGQMKQKGQGGAKGQRGQQGMQADKGSGEGDDQGEMQGRGERGEGPEGKQGGQQGKGPAELAQRQKALREKLDKMRRELQEKGLGEGEKLDQAGEAMESAEKALNEQDFAQANEDQGRALDAMRESAQEMAQQAQQNGQQRANQEGDSPRDPFGRPQRSQGPDQGTSVKVPDQIDMQRAREILDELRKRVGDAKRPPVELDYLERLLRRF